MTDTLDPTKIDKRLAQRMIKKGLLSEKEYEKQMKTLPDRAAEAAPIEATMEPTQVGQGAGQGTGPASDEE